MSGARTFGLVLLCGLVACSAPPTPLDAGGGDAAVVDAGLADAGSDAGSLDGGLLDAGRADAGGGDAGPGDAGNPSRFWDGGACMPKEDCPCFSSDDCAPTSRCQSEDMSGTRVFCVPGARGPGAVGQPCVDEASCQSALCVSGRDGGSLCSALCETAADCAPSVPRCVYVAFADRRMCLP